MKVLKTFGKELKTFGTALALLLFAVGASASTANPNLSAGGTNAGLVAAGTLGYTVLSPTDGTTVLQARSTSGITDQGNGYYVVTGGITFTTPSVLVKWDRSDTGAVLGIGTTAPTSSGTAGTVTYLTPALTHNTSLQPVLAWPADTTATRYKVMRSTDGINYTVIATLAAAILTYTDAARPIGGTCHYLVETTH